MSDDLTFDDEDSPTVTMKRADIRALEKKASKADELLGRAETAERHLAFAKAGIDLTDTKSNYFVKGYEGDLDLEKIREAAIKDGFLPDPSASTEQTTVEDQQTTDALGRMAEGAASAVDVPDAAFSAAMGAGSREEFYAALGQAGLTTNPT